jgi:hypothetical protein
MNQREQGRLAIGWHVAAVTEDAMAMAATMGPARQVHPADLASERRAADAQMTRAQRAQYDHEED